MQKKNIVLSIDNYKAEAYNSHYDMEEQGIYADYVILMGYDEHYAGSESGSVASIGFVEDGIKRHLSLCLQISLLTQCHFIQEYGQLRTEPQQAVP